MTDKESVKLSHRACHCISNLGSGKGFAPIESNKQLINLLLLVSDYVNHRQRPSVENVSNFRMVLCQIGITKSGKLQLRILLENEFIVENQVTGVEIKDRFQTLLPIDNGIRETFPVEINNANGEVGHVNLRNIIAIENRINQVCFIRS